VAATAGTAATADFGRLKTLSIGKSPKTLVTSHRTKAGASDAVPVFICQKARNYCVGSRL
jgi:hypothetical protein